MGRVADQTGIQFKMLNTGKGHAVRGPRCQSDRHRYREAITLLAQSAPTLTLVEGAAQGPPARRRQRRRRALRGRSAHSSAAVVVTTGRSCAR
jgi:tRNA uridine 5-carboxymethylaminomethyl modification enzyme